MDGLKFSHVAPATRLFAQLDRNANGEDGAGSVLGVAGRPATAAGFDGGRLIRRDRRRGRGLSRVITHKNPNQEKKNKERDPL